MTHLKPRTLVIVPTLGEREEGLRNTLESISRAGPAFSVIITPDVERLSSLARKYEFGPDYAVLRDDRKGIHRAINHVLASLVEKYEFVTWINDDDSLAPGSITSLEKILDLNPGAGAVFGDCAYVNDEGKKIWTNRFGNFATRVMWFGPDLIPQPGSLIRSRALLEAGFPDPEFGQAFDFELFLRIQRLSGGIVYSNRLVSYFGWHSGSETVEYRWRSVQMAAKARTANAQCWQQALVVRILNPFVMLLTYWAGKSLR